jgi:AAA domain
MSTQFAPTILFDSATATLPETRWLWHGLLGPGKLTLLTSLWKFGKTTLLSHLLAQRRTGGDFLGLSVTKGTSMVLSEEAPDLWQRRFDCHGLGAETTVLCRPYRSRPTVGQLTKLCSKIVECKEDRPDLVVFDTLSYFLPSHDENSARVMATALTPFAALAQAGVAVLLLHHPTKGEPPLGQAARGSGALLAAVDIFLEMRHPGGNPFSRRRRLFGWSRYDETPRQVLIELGADGKTYERLPDASDDFHEHWDIVRQILTGAEPLSLQVIRAAWPPSHRLPHPGTLWRWLDRAVELGLAIRTGKGSKVEPHRYALADAVEWEI